MNMTSADTLGRSAIPREFGQYGYVRSAERHWDDLAQHTKPEHLRVPRRLHASVKTQDKPKLYLQTRQRNKGPIPGVCLPADCDDPSALRGKLGQRRISCIDRSGDVSPKKQPAPSVDLKGAICFVADDLPELLEEVLLQRQRIDRNGLGKPAEAGVEIRVNDGDHERLLRVTVCELDRWSQEVIAQNPGVEMSPKSASPKYSITMSPELKRGSYMTTRDFQEKQFTLGRSSLADAGKAMSVQSTPWEEKRQNTEKLVNHVLKSGAKGSQTEQCTPEDGDDGSPQMKFTFDARRKFQQVLQNQVRASNERKFLASERLSNTVDFDLPFAGTYGKNRGTGAHSMSALKGIRSHFHNSCAVEAHQSRGPQSLGNRLDGGHIDHSILPELKPNVKLSRMTSLERSQQFSSYFPGMNPDMRTLKCQVAEDQKLDLRAYEFVAHEFRGDMPHRHGKHGRRAFDAQVREKPLMNPHGISEIENEPTEEVERERDRKRERLQRSLPLDQIEHFRTYLPTCDEPQKHQDLATKESIHFTLDGGGYLQFESRRCDPSDMDLRTRPLDASDMDKQLHLSC